MLFRLFSLLILSSLALGGCSKYMPNLDKVLPDQRKEYKKSTSLPDLEVPPDLTTESIDDTLAVPDVDANGTATFSTYQERVVKQKENRLYSGTTDNASIAELAGEQLIIVPRSTSDTWLTLQEFWSNLGYSLDLNDSELGIMETHWNGDEDSQSRDKFKVFIESAEESNRTAIYLSHVGEDLDQGSWFTRARDLTLERRVASRIKRSFGLASTPAVPSTIASATSSPAATAEPEKIRAELVNAGDGKRYLAVKSNVDTTWSLVSDFLNGASDITVEDESSAEGIFDIVYLGQETKKKSLVSKLTFWKSDNNEFQISVRGVGSSTEVTVLDEDGDWKSSDEADQILSRIKSSL